LKEKEREKLEERKKKKKECVTYSDELGVVIVMVDCSIIKGKQVNWIPWNLIPTMKASTHLGFFLASPFFFFFSFLTNDRPLLPIGEKQSTTTELSRGNSSTTEQ
jgi:hypothetical protein